MAHNRSVHAKSKFEAPSSHCQNRIETASQSRVHGDFNKLLCINELAMRSFPFCALYFAITQFVSDVWAAPPHPPLPPVAPCENKGLSTIPAKSKGLTRAKSHKKRPKTAIFCQISSNLDPKQPLFAAKKNQGKSAPIRTDSFMPTTAFSSSIKSSSYRERSFGPIASQEASKADQRQPPRE